MLDQFEAEFSNQLQKKKLVRKQSLIANKVEVEFIPYYQIPVKELLLWPKFFDEKYKKDIKTNPRAIKYDPSNWNQLMKLIQGRSKYQMFNEGSVSIIMNDYDKDCTNYNITGIILDKPKQ